MKIVHISTKDVAGGAARAAYNLHQGLLQLGEESMMLVRRKQSEDNTVLTVAVEPDVNSQSADLLGAIFQTYYIDLNRSDFSNSFFSVPISGFDLSRLPLLHNADIINLHWVARFLSPPVLKNLFEIGKPIVWTLHDHWPFTGGCHFSGGCNRYQTNCQPCPQLVTKCEDMPGRILDEKLVAHQDANLTIVAPSNWMAACARQSILFKGQPIEVIPYSIDTDLFKPYDQSTAREFLQLDDDTLIILFGAHDLDEDRKGVSHLLSAIKLCLEDDRFREQVDCGKVRLLFFGYQDMELETLALPSTILGLLDHDNEIPFAYAAADLFILTSLEDNLPNTLLEAMSCGTPVIAYSVGGVPDVIDDGHSGVLVPVGEVQELAKAILLLSFDQQKRKEMGNKIRQKALAEFPLSKQAEEYQRLYQSKLKGASSVSHIVEEITGTQQVTENDQKPNALVEQQTLMAKVDTMVSSDIGDMFDQALLEGLKAYALSTEAKMQKKDEQIEEKKHKLAETRQKLAELNRQLTQANRRVDQVHQDSNKLKQRLKAADQQLERLGDDVQQLQQELAQANQQIIDYEELLTVKGTIKRVAAVPGKLISKSKGSN